MSPTILFKDIDEPGLATLAVYEGLSEPDGNVPAWITNLASSREMPDLFRALRRCVASSRQPPAPAIAEIAEMGRN